MKSTKSIPPKVLAKADHEFVELFGKRVMRIHSNVISCKPHGIECAFIEEAGSTCSRICHSSIFWITEKQLPKVLAAKLTG